MTVSMLDLGIPMVLEEGVYVLVPKASYCHCVLYLPH